MSETEREIVSQPELWRRAADEATGTLGILPAPGERVAAVGCGTSWFVCQAYARLRETAALGETEAVAASEFTPRAYDRVVLLSRSGTTTEVIRLAEALRATTRTVAVSAVAGTPVPGLAGDAIVLAYADEASVVQTRFATTALALLRASVGGDLAPVVGDAERAVVMPLPHDPAAFDHFVFLGHGWTVGLANEAALKLREAAQAHTESYPAMEYRHGPVSVAGPSSLVWILGTPDGAVAEDVRATGATVRTAEFDPMAELVLIQRTAVALAQSRGLDPDHPRHLTRSVVLS
jgi:glucosamine--fructose-6-phosphate aminotransferase (isomerizing)